MKGSTGFRWKEQPIKDKADIRGKKKKRDDPPPDAEPQNKGEVIYDATVCPQGIAYPTDLGLLKKAREITEEIINVLHQKQPQANKPRNYRELAPESLPKGGAEQEPLKEDNQETDQVAAPIPQKELQDDRKAA